MGIAALLWLATEATDYGMQVGDNTYAVTARFSNVADLKDRAPRQNRRRYGRPG